ncbi:MAG: site-specific integrase, partial [Clostridiales bacterium]|nr:site-specific integrase [Clostridiales bacterium]
DKNGKWYAKFYYRDYEGNSKQKLKRGFALKRDAETYEVEFLASQNFQPDMLFSTFYYLYLKDITPRLREHTLQTKSYRAKNHILPFFGDMKINEITALDIRAWQNSKLEADYSLKYLQNLQKELSAIFNHAMRFYGLRNNPCRQAGPPVKADDQKSVMRYWSLNEFKQVINATEDIKAKTALTLLYWSGMRKGELLALRWSKLDFEACTVTINESYQRIKGKPVITPTKTNEARTIKLPEVCIEQLKEYRQCCYKPKPDDHVFHWEKRFIEQGIKQACGVSGVKPIHVHGLRHSHAFC